MSSHLFDLSGRTALVTGSTRGIGLAIARGLGRAGARVVVHGRDAARARDVAESLRGEGIAATSHAFDLADAEAVLLGVEAVEVETGGIHILVNNAGFIERGPLTEFDLGTWRRTLDINVTSAMVAARALVPAMIERGGGKIINIASRAAYRGETEFADYGASKAALVNLTRSIARACAKDNIVASCVAPGFILTEMAKGEIEAHYDDIVDQIPLRRVGSVDDVASAILFLASPMADYLNGVTIDVNGGSWFH